MSKEKGLLQIKNEIEKQIRDAAKENKLDTQQTIWILSTIIGGLSVDIYDEE